MRIENITSTLRKTEEIRNLGVSIRGLALSHFDSETGQWKIFFPKAPNHNFVMIVRKSRDGEFLEENHYQLMATRKIEIITNGRIGNGSLNRQAIASIPDLSDLHGERLHLINDRNRYAGFLILNEATLTTEPQEEEREFEIWKIRTSPTLIHRQYVNTKKLGVASDAGFNFEPESRTEISIENEFDLELIHEENVNYEITFDNDCHQGMSVGCPESDFKFYYDIIDETKLVTKCRFDLIFIPPIDDPTKGGEGGVCGKGKVTELTIPDGLL